MGKIKNNQSILLQMLFYIFLRFTYLFYNQKQIVKMFFTHHSFLALLSQDLPFCTHYSELIIERCLEKLLHKMSLKINY